MSCLSCVHRFVCEKEDGYDPTLENCDMYRSICRSQVIFDHRDFETAMEYLLKVRHSLMQIRKSKNRDSAEFWLDQAIDKLQGK